MIPLLPRKKQKNQQVSFTLPMYFGFCVFNYKYVAFFEKSPRATPRNAYAVTGLCLLDLLMAYLFLKNPQILAAYFFKHLNCMIVALK